MNLTPAQTSYLVDFVLGFVGAGIIGAAALFPASGPISWQAIGFAFLGGVVGFLRKYSSVQSGADSVPVPKEPDKIAVAPPSTTIPPIRGGAAQQPQYQRPWGSTGLGWIAAILLVFLIFSVLIGVTSFAAPNILLIAFALIALALLL